MNLGEIYPWLKGLHVASAVIFVGGVLATSAILAAVGPAPRTEAVRSCARAVGRWDRRITTPAMLLVWGLGLALGLTGHHLGSAWLQAKLVFVVVLSGLHGVQSGRLRRLMGDAAVSPTRSSPILIACILAIAVLAVVKPG